MTNVSWQVCPACSLRHSARPNGRCPRCGGAVLSAPGATPRGPRGGSARGPGRGRVGLAAGLGLVVLAFLIVAAKPQAFAKLRGTVEGFLASFRSEAPPPRPTPDTQRTLAETPIPPPSASTPTYLQKAFSDLPHPRPTPAHRR
jgi:hypothetical protein